MIFFALQQDLEVKLQVVSCQMIFLSFFITSLSAEIDLSHPTNKGITILGKTTMSLKGNKGNDILTSIALIWILYIILQ